MAEKSNAYAMVIADLKRQRDEIDAIIARLEAMAVGKPTKPDFAGTAKVQETIEDLDQAPEDNPYLGMSIGDATKELLVLKRKPMTPPEIVAHLEAGGIVLGGTNKSNTVGSVLNRRQSKVGDIVSVKRGTWGLKEWYRGRNFGKKPPEESDVGRESEVTVDASAEPNEREQPFDRPQIVPLRSNE